MKPDFTLTDKTILVTGASSGIGQATAQAIAASGGKTVLVGRNNERLQATLDSLEGKGHSIVQADLLNPEERNALTKATDNLDGAVHAAGLVAPFPIKFLSEGKLAETMRINFEVPVLLSASLLKQKKFNANASHIMLSSISGEHPHKGGAAYAASKAALQSFVKTLALETYHQNMRVNCVSPAMVKTAMYDKAESGMSKESMDEHVSKYPLGVGTPEDVAAAIVFLLSPASKWITGINLTLDGGFLLEAK